MHAIQRYHYDRLQDYLQYLENESGVLDLPVDHSDTIVHQKKKLKQLYNNYQAALQEVGEIIKQYDLEYKSIRRLMSSHKQYRKDCLRKKIG